MKIGTTRKLFLALSLLVFVGACSNSNDAKIVESAVEKFHAQFNQEQYHEIYTGAGEEFQRASAEQDFAPVLSNAHGKLGAAKDSKQVGWYVKDSNGEKTIVATYETTFERGKGAEQFTWSMKGDGVKLLLYDISSPTLVLK
jgi:outer membrane lipoprotein-sorting protein